MKLKRLNQTCIIITLTVLSACSKQNVQSTAETNSSTQDASPIMLRNVYSVSLGGANSYNITELENTGKVGVKAFKGKWTVTDDLNTPLEEQEIRFTGDTSFITAGGIKSSHIISPGEKFLIINQIFDGEAGEVFATDKENITSINGNVRTNGAEGMVKMLGYTSLGKMGHFGAMVFSEPNLPEDRRVTKKTTFEVEKIVNQ